MYPHGVYNAVTPPPNTEMFMATPIQRLAVFEVSGMTCGSCEVRIRSALMALPGVNDAVVSRPAGRTTVSHDPAVIGEAALASAIIAAGYAVRAADAAAPLPDVDPEPPARGCDCCSR